MVAHQAVNRKVMVSNPDADRDQNIGNAFFKFTNLGGRIEPCGYMFIFETNIH